MFQLELSERRCVPSYLMPHTLAECDYQTVAELLHRAEQLKVPPLEVVECIVDGKIPDIKPSVKKKLANFVGIIRDLRRFAKEVRL